MATDEVVTDNTVDGAASAIEALLKGSGTGEQPAAPQPDPIQPQAAAPAPASEASVSEEVQAPAIVAPAPDQQPEPARVSAPTSSPDLEAARQEAATKAQEANALRERFLNALDTYIPQLEAAVKGEFADIQTQDDLLKLGAIDPERYNRAVIAFTRLNNARTQQETARREAEQKSQQEQRAKFEQWQQGELKKLGELIPDLKDQAKGPALAKRIQDYAFTIGYTAQQLAQASAVDFVTLRNAMEYANLEKARAEAAKKAANAPPVQQPGAVRDTNAKADQAQESFSRLQKTGRIDDAAQVMRNFL